MSQADQIRETALATYIQPARTAGDEEVTIKAGDLHRQMKLSNAMPSVCSALRSGKFEQLAKVRRVEVSGPFNGANVYFRYALIDQGDGTDRVVSPAHSGLSRQAKIAVTRAACAIDLSDALVLVSCVKSKLPQAAPARLLYCLDLFTKVRRLIEAQNARWFVLSALYGLLPVDQEIAPYELTLNTMGAEERRAWAAKVFQALEPELKGHKRVVFFAGQRYREFLVEPTRRVGLQVEVPMEGLAFGEQLAWLSASR